jgi:hypothetical protein
MKTKKLKLKNNAEYTINTKVHVCISNMHQFPLLCLRYTNLEPLKKQIKTKTLKLTNNAKNTINTKVHICISNMHQFPLHRVFIIFGTSNKPNYSRICPNGHLP